MIIIEILLKYVLERQNAVLISGFTKKENIKAGIKTASILKSCNYCMIFRTGSGANHFQILCFVVLFFIIESNAFAIDIPDSTNKKSFPAPG